MITSQAEELLAGTQLGTDASNRRITKIAPHLTGLGRKGWAEGGDHGLKLFIQVAELGVRGFKPFPRCLCLIDPAIAGICQDAAITHHKAPPDHHVAHKRANILMYQLIDDPVMRTPAHRGAIQKHLIRLNAQRDGVDILETYSAAGTARGGVLNFLKPRPAARVGGLRL